MSTITVRKLQTDEPSLPLGERLIEAGLISEDQLQVALTEQSRHDEPLVARYNEQFQKRLGKDPAAYSAIGGVDEMMALVHDFHAAGVHKFVLRPIASGTEDMLAQTRLMEEQLLPAISALNHKAA